MQLGVSGRKSAEASDQAARQGHNLHQNQSPRQGYLHVCLTEGCQLPFSEDFESLLVDACHAEICTNPPGRTAAADPSVGIDRKTALAFFSDCFHCSAQSLLMPPLKPSYRQEVVCRVVRLRPGWEELRASILGINLAR